MLERKYGGVKARIAALTIQRAFRRYTLRKKFAAITAMAKAEKRISRRINNVDDTRSIVGDADNCDQEYRNFDTYVLMFYFMWLLTDETFLFFFSFLLKFFYFFINNSLIHLVEKFNSTIVYHLFCIH